MNPLRLFADLTRPLRRKLGLFRNKKPFYGTDLTDPELDALLGSFRETKPQIYVELGVFRGGSFRRVLELRRELGLKTQCFGVDLWDEIKDPAASTHISGAPNRKQIAANLNRHGLTEFTLLAGLATDLKRLIPGRVDLFFHDANHTYQAVYDEMEYVREIMQPGGRLLVHNASLDMKPDVQYVAADGGPHRAIQEHVAAKRWELLEIRDRMAVLRLPA